MIRPHEFNNATVPTAWFMKFEAFARMYSTLDWLGLLVSSVSENCLRKIKNLEHIETKHDRYYLLKNAMISKFGCKKTFSETFPKLQDLKNRIQKNYESLRHYSTVLRNLAKKLLSSLSENIFGLTTQIDRETALNKLNKSKLKNESISFDHSKV